MLGRISTYSMHQTLVRDSNQVQAELAMMQRQISSGKKGDTFELLAGRVEYYTGLVEKMNRADTYIKQNNVILSRIGTADQSMQTIVENATQARNLIVMRRNPGLGESLQLSINMQEVMKNIADALNVNVGGTYLFAGSKTDTRPVELPYSPLASGAPDGSYYRGDDVQLSTRSNDTLTVDYGIRANEEGFQKLFAAMALAIEADSSAGGDSKLAAAQDLINEAIDEVIAIRVRNQANKVALDKSNVRNDALRGYWKGLSEDESNTDTVEVTTRAAVHQSILQATFQVFARVSSLTLSNYLR